MRKLGIVLVLLLAAFAAAAACAPGFDPQSKVDSVRLFATRADKPYARPGETVTLEALYTDARRDKPRPLKNYWIPVVCMNPRDDLYYLCFVPTPGGGADGGVRFVPGGAPSDGGTEAGTLPPGIGGDAGAGGGDLLSRIPVGVDLGPFLPQGETFSFRMPDDAVQPRLGIDPYGIAYVFNILCAGKIIRVERDPAGGPQQVPIQCVDDENQKLSPSDYVIGISRVYAQTTKTNTNPVIEKITVDGIDVNLQEGIRLPKCVAQKRIECPEHKIDIRVSDSSWEDNPSESAAQGKTVREQVWAAYYADQGDFQDDARLLFDTNVGRVSDSAIVYRAPYDPVRGTIWAVVHDNRGGASWAVIPLRVE